MLVCFRGTSVGEPTQLLVFPPMRWSGIGNTIWGLARHYRRSGPGERSGPGRRHFSSPWPRGHRVSTPGGQPPAGGEVPVDATCVRPGPRGIESAISFSRQRQFADMSCDGARAQVAFCGYPHSGPRSGGTSHSQPRRGRNSAGHAGRHESYDDEGKPPKVVAVIASLGETPRGHIDLQKESAVVTHRHRVRATLWRCAFWFLVRRGHRLGDPSCIVGTHRARHRLVRGDHPICAI